MVQETKAEERPKISCPTVKIDAERLPDLNIPRYGHSAFVVNGEVTVVGGHTSGFVLTPTAEYFKDGEWHLLHTIYPHDGGFSVVLKSGKVMVAGGFKENLGIGQSFEVETYDPIVHRFDGFGCLDQKRASATAIELDCGQVLVTGNWYEDDGMECFDGQERFLHLKPVRQPRYQPHLFRTANGDVLVLAGYGSKNQPIDSLLVERMKGEPFSPPLLKTWHPLHYDLALHSDDSFIGDEGKSIFAYLMPVIDNNGQVAIAEVRDTIFSLLSTNSPVPMASPWGKISYYTPVYADRLHQRGYVMGCDSTGRQYVLCVDYAKKPAHLTLYHTDPLTDTLTLTIPVMVDDGNLMLTGIKSAARHNSNFMPTAQVWLLRFNDNGETLSSSTVNGWLWAGLTLAVILIIIFILLKIKAKPAKVPEDEDIAAIPKSANTDDELMERIIHLIEEKKLYLNSELTTSDIAKELNMHRNYISACVNSQKGHNFNRLLNSYRIEYAKQLMQQYPDKKINTIANESGFANETSFYRTFKAITGMTPKEWLASMEKKNKEND